MTLLVVFSVAVAALLVAGFLYQRIGGSLDRRRYTGPGRWVEIERGRRLYVVEKGSGGPAVLFEAGIAATNLNWHHIQETVSRFTSTASYDRSGLGWSSPSSTVRTPGNIAAELHTMLQSAGIKPPYILVGHSFGGLVVRRYAVTYPEDVAGVVLIDPMRCKEWPPLNPAKQSMIDRGKKLSGYAILIARFGLARLAVTSLLCRSGRISGHLAGAALDTYAVEPLPADSPLRGLANVVLSPHVAGQTKGAVLQVGLAAAQAILDELAGRRPRFVVNPAAYAARSLRA